LQLLRVSCVERLHHERKIVSRFSFPFSWSWQLTLSPGKPASSTATPARGDMLKHSTIGVGRDAGGWNCDNNSKSRDALVIVGALGELLGQPWRGNLRHVINEAVSTADFLAKIFGLCRLASGFSNSSVTVAIDAPLCFPESLIALLTAGRTERSLGDSAANPYLYRFTERRLATVPLSTVKDMIGSRLTKAIHATGQVCGTIQSLGVWSDGGTTRFIELISSMSASGSREEFSSFSGLTTSSMQASAPDCTSPPLLKLLNLRPQKLRQLKAGYGCRPTGRCRRSSTSQTTAHLPSLAAVKPWNRVLIVNSLIADHVFR
jgi:hypothetical protein